MRPFHSLRWDTSVEPLCQADLDWQRGARRRIRALLRSIQTSVQKPLNSLVVSLDRSLDGVWESLAAKHAAEVAAKVAAILAEADRRQIQLSFGDLTVSRGAWIMWVGVQGRRQLLYKISSIGGESYDAPYPKAVLSWADASARRAEWRRERDAERRKRQAAPAERQAQQWAQQWAQHGGERRRHGY
tara:strand:+ start:608 stop:1168 length:561 start_codon:yes stop_codon:yes gene_type:complete